MSSKPLGPRVFHQVQVINAMLASICGVANEILLLGFPLHQTAVAPTKMQSEMETEPKSFPVLLTAKATTPRLEVALDLIFPSLPPLQNFWAQFSLISSALLGFDIASRERPVERTLAQALLNPLTALGQREKNTGEIEENNQEILGKEKGTKVETLTASQCWDSNLFTFPCHEAWLAGKSSI